MANKKSNAELRAELRMHRQHGIGNNITKIIRDIIKWGAIVAIVYYGYLSIDTLSGRTTKANIDINAQGVLSLNEGSGAQGATKDAELPVCRIVILIALIFGIGGVVYGRRQAKLRKDVIERHHYLVQKAEKRIDPGRSTSQLTQRGDTRPEDD